jgi:hypothetical protein
MDKLYNDLVPEDRLAQIKAEAIRQETMQYEKPLSDDELIELKDEQNILSFVFSDLKRRKRNSWSSIKTKRSLLKSNRKKF